MYQRLQKFSDPTPIAAKPRPGALRVGSTFDPLEREADRMADQAVQGRTVSSFIGQDAQPGTVRRTTHSPYSYDEGEEDTAVQAKAHDGGASFAGPAASASVEAAVQSPGAPLPPATRTQMEGFFGHDFSRVRIHAGSRAAEAARSVNARAFTRGASIVFDHGQYAPDSRTGQWLLAHELTHVVQQGQAPRQGENASPEIQRDPSPALRRMKWNTARDTGKDKYPWGKGPNGDVYEAETDAGTKIPVWKPHDGSTYWCHGYTFGGSGASNGPFSIWGQDVPTVVADDGWQRADSCVAHSGDILVFWGNNVAHSGIVHSSFEPGGIVDEDASEVDSKWGQAPLERSSWTKTIKRYGKYEVFSKSPAQGPCAGKGANER